MKPTSSDLLIAFILTFAWGYVILRLVRDGYTGGVLMTEHTEQCTLFEWAAIKARQIPELEFLFAVPNGGFRHKATAGRLRAEGLKAGVLDVCWPVPRGKYHGLWIEMKHGKNTPTRHQKRWIEFLEDQGHYVAVCYGWDDASETIETYWKLGPPWV